MQPARLKALHGPSRAEVRKARTMVYAVIEHHFGQRPQRVVRQGGGLTNFVFEVERDGGALIVRLSSDRAKINTYIKEQWAIANVRVVGVPTQDILEVGNAVVPYPYMVTAKVAGQSATHHPDRLKILREMGRYTALIHSVRTTGFGQTFDWSGNQLSKNPTWKDFLHGELNVVSRLEILRRHRMLSRPQLKKVQAALWATEGWARRPALNHGDMRLKNVLVDDAGKISAIIDWEHCVSCIAPHWDLSVALHDLSIDAKEEFLAGYGLTNKEFRHIAPVLKALNIINYAPDVEGLGRSKSSKQLLEQYRTRLSGAFDLYSL